MRLILASTSPRRRELLSLLELPFDIVAPAFEERIRPHVPAVEQARSFAEGKARTVAAAHPEAVVLGSDTLIEVDQRVVGKPQTLEEARAMLTALRGRRHRIWTAVAVCRLSIGFQETALPTVDVWMKAWSDAELDAYLLTSESLDKAGGYAIQGRGADLIERIEGDYTAAVGLPLRASAELLANAQCRTRVDLDDLYRRRPYLNWSRFA